jgi:uncharacterized membrane protein
VVFRGIPPNFSFQNSKEFWEIVKCPANSDERLEVKKSSGIQYQQNSVATLAMINLAVLMKIKVVSSFLVMEEELYGTLTSGKSAK